MSPTETIDQLALDETVIEDAVLESALDERQNLRDEAAALRAEMKPIQTRVDAGIEKLELPDGGIARVGRYRITRKDLPEREVAFTAKATSRVSITLADED